MAAPQGNNNATKNKAWSDALRRELEGNQNADKLKKMAKKLVALATEEGNMQAFKEIGDRLEGKPMQSMDIAITDMTHEEALDLLDK